MNSKSETIEKLASALCNVQSELRGAKADAENPFFKSKYADLRSVWEACREPLTKNGLSIIQTTDFINDKVCVVTTLVHTSGQWISGILPVNAKTNDPQGTGSAITYARRYALSAIVGLYQEDDDAESAMARTTQKPFHSTNQPMAPTSSSQQQQQLPQAQAYSGEPGDYITPYGRDKGRKIKELPKEDIEASLKYWNEKLSSDGKKPQGQLAQYMLAMSAYLSTLSNLRQSEEQSFEDLVDLPI